ncbi:hypothetical protein XENOCAPTIV_024501 [Xenoophorus captivus]|uniref:Uncharacterized protein n=1 Tax=Xenoophorus captivus TaxID=1517983 RepID=A0ABV0QTD3_9TELE
MSYDQLYKDQSSIQKHPQQYKDTPSHAVTREGQKEDKFKKKKRLHDFCLKKRMNHKTDVLKDLQLLARDCVAGKQFHELRVDLLLHIILWLPIHSLVFQVIIFTFQPELS